MLSSSTRKESLPMGKHRSSAPDGIPAVTLIHRHLPDAADTDVLPAITPDPPSRPRVGPWLAGLAVVGSVAASAVPLVPAADDHTGPLARITDDLPDRGAISQAVATERLSELAASRARREAEQAAALQVQAAAEVTAQEAQAAAEEQARKAETPAVSPVAHEAPRPPEHPTETSPSGPAADVAVQTALAQRGKPYVWGAVGPSSFDCSGLVLYAYKAAGISLPRVSADQARAGVAITRDQLQPGDLVAYYSPVSHIGIYIGNGQIVHAPEPGDVVKVTDIDAFGSAPTAYRRVT